MTLLRKTTQVIFFLFLSLHLQAQYYTFESVSNDPTGTRIYTLSNGLKVYLSVNKTIPRIQTYMTVKTGSKNDPADLTGLAHYLEHMLFKGSSKIGSLDWEKEKVILAQIADLYELHKAEQDDVKKKSIYHQIDSLSGIAAKYVVPNELDKMMTGLGAEGTNAYTSLENTSYISDIPATELEKWLMLESERFSELVLRLFHTELEAVYEEFNKSQDEDRYKVYHAMNRLLYPTHPYGTQTTIGEGIHLKNPSMKSIHAYFKQYYVPNNMAICLAGDFDYDQTIRWIDMYFGKFKPGAVNAPVMPKEKLQTEIKIKEVYGPSEESVSIGFRTGGYHTEDKLMLNVLSEVLNNGNVGLIDLNLIQAQKVLNAYAYGGANHDYGELLMGGNPQNGQTLEQVKDLLLAELDKVKKGEFDDDMISWIVKNNKKDYLNAIDLNWLRAANMSEAFVMEANWIDYVDYFDRMGKITKTDLIAWVQKNFRADNYCIVYKKTGTDKNVLKVEKPTITPIDINRKDQSTFFRDFEKKESLRLKPVFIDFDKELARKEIESGVKFYYLPNQTNELFYLFIELDEDLQKDKTAQLAVQYIDYLGTDQYSAEEIKKQFYKMGVSYSVGSGYISLSGLNESFEEAFKLLQHLIEKCKPNQDVLKKLIADTKKSRADNKLNKNYILSGIQNYATYGTKNPFNDEFSDKELDKIKAEDLCLFIKNMMGYHHSYFYYGKNSQQGTYGFIQNNRYKKQPVVKYKKIEFPRLDIKESKVYFVNYDMVQTELKMVTKGKNFDPSILPYAYMYNSYFGDGLSSIVFQEIRESKALAYTAYSYFSNPYRKEDPYMTYAYIGAQSNKLSQAVEAMQGLMNQMPKSEKLFEQSRILELKSIETDRMTKTDVYWRFKGAERRGLAYDVRKDVYEQLSKMNIDEFEKFFNENIKGKKYAYCVIGKKSDMDMNSLRQLGTVQELSLKEVFGY